LHKHADGVVFEWHCTYIVYITRRLSSFSASRAVATFEATEAAASVVFAAVAAGKHFCD